MPACKGGRKIKYLIRPYASKSEGDGDRWCVLTEIRYPSPLVVQATVMVAGFTGGFIELFATYTAQYSQMALGAVDTHERPD